MPIPEECIVSSFVAFMGYATASATCYYFITRCRQVAVSTDIAVRKPIPIFIRTYPKTSIFELM